MATKVGEDEVELELCLSLGGPFKKLIESPKNGKIDAVRCVNCIGVDLNGGTTKRDINATTRNETRKKRERNQQGRTGEEGECKKIRTECNGIHNGAIVGVDLSFTKVANGYGYGYGYGYGSGHFNENSKPVTIALPICSSSEVSDPSSSSPQEGGSSNSGVNSDQTKPAKSSVNNIQTDTEETTDGSNDAVVVEAKEIGKPPKPRYSGNGVNGGSLLPFTQMPCVSSTGNGPEGKTVNGFLYRYSKSEISIICVCHGTSFTPAEFIIHAGGNYVSHPLRHITVVPSKF